MPNQDELIPIYLFLGFLESGKTKFIQETLEDKRFNKGEKTLLLVCEEEGGEGVGACVDLDLAVRTERTEIEEGAHDLFAGDGHGQVEVDGLQRFRDVELARLAVRTHAAPVVEAVGRIRTLLHLVDWRGRVRPG